MKLYRDANPRHTSHLSFRNIHEYRILSPIARSANRHFSLLTIWDAWIPLHFIWIYTEGMISYGGWFNLSTGRLNCVAMKTELSSRESTPRISIPIFFTVEKKIQKICYLKKEGEILSTTLSFLFLILCDKWFEYLLMSELITYSFN